VEARSVELMAERVKRPFAEVSTGDGTAGEEAIRPEIDPSWALLRRVAGADERAFTELVKLYQDRLLRLAERLLGEAEEARDAVQDVFLKVWRKAASAQPRGQLYTWLYRIAVNHCLNRLRRRKIVRFLRLEAPWREGSEGSEGPGGAAGDLPFDPPQGGADPEERLLARRRWQRTKAAIAALPANQRAVLVLARFEGLSYREIAEVLGITLGAVESRLFRAMRALEGVLREAE